MRDPDIRQALDRELTLLHCMNPHTVIRHELGLCAGTRRIDVAVVNGSLDGWEIKSDVDTLARLAGQAAVYAQVLDHVTVVTTARHASKATSMLPTWWGVVTASVTDGDVVLQQTRPPEQNHGQRAMSLAQLLWREEALDELKQRDLGRGLSKAARHHIWLRLADALPLEDLKAVVRDRLRARPEWPGGRPRLPDDDLSRRHATV